MKGKHLYKHGGHGTRLYFIWKHMKQRTTNPKDKSYHRYGGRGITVCDEWANNYVAFRDWAFANGYSDSLTIDRIDNDKGYSPENCRWADWQTQSENRPGFCRAITAFGKTHTIAEWSRITGIHQETIRSRINRLGWDSEEAVKKGAKL